MPELSLGLLVPVSDAPEQMARAAEMGLTSCQVASWQPEEWTPDRAAKLAEVAGSCRVEISAFWCGYTGRAVWDFLEGPATIGLVPEAHRRHRTDELKQGTEFAAALGVPGLVTHAGFIPEDPKDPAFAPTVEALREVAEACEARGLGFWLETGQETPVTMLRTLERIGTGNMGVNLDTANLLMYGKANPVDALEVFGSYVRGVHAKDGRYPTDPDHLGHETPIGEGSVDFPAVLSRLKELGYTGPLTIEREISGPQQIADVKAAIEYLRPLL